MVLIYAILQKSEICEGSGCGSGFLMWGKIDNQVSFAVVCGREWGLTEVREKAKFPKIGDVRPDFGV